MIKKILAAAILSLAIASPAQTPPAYEMPAAGGNVAFNSYCGKSPDVFKELRNDFKEVPQIVSPLASHPTVTMSVWVNLQNKTTSVVISYPNNVSCIVFGGEGGKFNFGQSI